MQKRREYDRQSTERDYPPGEIPAPRLEIAFCFVHPLVLCHLPYTCPGDDRQRGCSSSLLILLKKARSSSQFFVSANPGVRKCLRAGYSALPIRLPINQHFV